MWTQTPPIAAELEEREDEVVVARVEVEAEAGNAPRLLEVVVRLLHRADVLDLRQLGDRLGLDVDDDAAGNVVDDDRLVGVRGDLLNVAHDRALRRLVVVRGDDEERVDAELVRLLRELRGVVRVIRARAGDDGCAAADSLHGGGEELELLVIRERRALPCRAGDDDAVGAVVDEIDRKLAELVEVDRAVGAERRHDRGQDFAEHGANSTRYRAPSRARATSPGRGSRPL